LDAKSILESIRAFSFGGLVAAGIGAIIYFSFQAKLAFISPYWFIGGCGALGTAGQQAIHGVLNIIFKPLFRFIDFHRKLYELDRLARSGRISADRHEELIHKLCEKRFLNS